MFTTQLLKILVCPVTKQQLTYDQQNQLLISRKAELAYPIRGSIPVLLVNQAIKLEEHYLNKKNKTKYDKAIRQTKKVKPPNN